MKKKNICRISRRNLPEKSLRLSSGKRHRRVYWTQTDREKRDMKMWDMRSSIAVTCSLPYGTGSRLPGGGGTADIVSYAREMGRAYIHIDPDGGTSVLSETNVFFKGLRHLNTLNAEQTPGGTDEEMCWFSETLRNGCAKYGLSSDLIAPLEEDIIPAFARIDQLAMHYQKRHLNAGTMIALLATLAVATVTIQVLFIPHHPEVLWLEFLEMATIIGTIIISRRGEWHRKWIEYRIIAEQLRAYPFLILAGMNPTERRGTDPGDHGADDWTGMVIADFWKHPPSLPESIHENNTAIFNFITGEYLEDQARYYRKANSRHENRDETLEKVGIGLFIITMLASALHALGVGHSSAAHDAVLQIPALLTFFAILLPASGGALATIQVQREYRKNALRYDAIARQLTILIRRMRASQTLETSREILGEAYALITSENQDWRITLIVRQLHPA
ncbi:hypothetical protein [Methanofollis ethanolicus]|uniref:hypothetical protein n=1 Tax=Methanofollis ethanolicus TaxID=488124 RepID=UPI00128EB904|nr:hypothetical protein [Methanofollis ethanolicus]